MSRWFHSRNGRQGMNACLKIPDAPSNADRLQSLPSPPPPQSLPRRRAGLRSSRVALKQPDRRKYYRLSQRVCCWSGFRRRCRSKAQTRLPAHADHNDYSIRSRYASLLIKQAIMCKKPQWVVVTRQIDQNRPRLLFHTGLR